jgi:hypothetical protein
MVSTTVAPIFVRGLSRSGGTLMVTMLDAHPAIAMSYELYPNLLALEDPSPAGVEAEIRCLKPKKGRQFAAEVANPRFKTFLNRTARGGMSPEAVEAALRSHLAGHGGFETAGQRLRFVERCALAKCEAENKGRWGTKLLIGDFADFDEMFPGTQIVNVVRDGRDVLASQLNTGSFEGEPAKLGRSWASNHRKFRRLMERLPEQAHEVSYERLVREPEATLRDLCANLAIPYADEMVRYHELDLTLFKASHLSLERVMKPPDATSIGRWKRDLDADQLRAFLDAAGEAMDEFGYET